MNSEITASTILGDFLIQRGKMRHLISFRKFTSFFPKRKRRSEEVAKLYRQFLKSNKQRLATVGRNIQLERTIIDTKINDKRQKDLAQHINDQGQDDNEEEHGGDEDFEHMAFKALFPGGPDPHAQFKDLETINNILIICITKLEQDLFNFESEFTQNANLMKIVNEELNDVTYSKSDGQQQIQEAIHAVTALYDQVKQLDLGEDNAK